MGSTDVLDFEGENEIPFLDFSNKALNHLKGKSELWEAMCVKVREACENHGCFLVKYDGISCGLREDMLMAMKSLFDLPAETKQKHVCSKPYRSYLGNCPLIPLSESFGMDEAPQHDVAHTFTNLMWPQGNPSFCGTIVSMSSKMQELNFLVLKMILESFGMGKQYESHIENMTSNFRLMKYKVPASNGDSVVGLTAHTDKSNLTTLSQNEVQGLEVMSKEGNWVRLRVPNGCFLIMVGDILKAWSNGRLQAAKHRVIITGEKDRYSCGLFTLPKEDVMIEVPHELADKDHPLLYRPFSYGEYFSYYTSNLGEDALEAFAGL